jgi:hypothetical protein
LGAVVELPPRVLAISLVRGWDAVSREVLQRGPIAKKEEALEEARAGRCECEERIQEDDRVSFINGRLETATR